MTIGDALFAFYAIGVACFLIVGGLVGVYGDRQTRPAMFWLALPAAAFMWPVVMVSSRLKKTPPPKPTELTVDQIRYIQANERYWDLRRRNIEESKRGQ